MGKIMAVCTSDRKGIQKERQKEIVLLEDYGIDKDAHAGKWHRQVSLLSYEKIEAFKAKGVDLKDGAFGENIVVSGIDLSSLPIGTILKSEEVELEVTQIGKKCHHHCEIYKVVGDCIMPREGIFTKVIKGGILKAGDELNVVEE
ncbi:MAG: MOSC domain-containing protein [Vallitalea sp.]|jgi:TatD DNase family protein|nr:MOSC domain-containing protein [Vallitalea sp.]